MIDEERDNLHRLVVEKYMRGQVAIDVNTSSALLVYSMVSRNPLIKLFHFVIRVYSFPLTIVAVIFASVFVERYVYVLCYVVGLFGLVGAETYLSKIATVTSVLENQRVFSSLQRRGVIFIRDVVNPDSPV